MRGPHPVAMVCVVSRHPDTLRPYAAVLPFPNGGGFPTSPSRIVRILTELVRTDRTDDSPGSNLPRCEAQVLAPGYATFALHAPFAPRFTVVLLTTVRCALAQRSVTPKRAAHDTDTPSVVPAATYVDQWREYHPQHGGSQHAAGQTVTFGPRAGLSATRPLADRRRRQSSVRPFLPTASAAPASSCR